MRTFCAYLMAACVLVLSGCSDETTAYPGGPNRNSLSPQP